MGTSRSKRDKTDTFNTSKLINEDVLFSKQYDFDKITFLHYFRPSRGINVVSSIDIL